MPRNYPLNADCVPVKKYMFKLSDSSCQAAVFVGFNSNLNIIYKLNLVAPYSSCRTLDIF